MEVLAQVEIGGLAFPLVGAILGVGCLVAIALLARAGKIPQSRPWALFAPLAGALLVILSMALGGYYWRFEEEIGLAVGSPYDGPPIAVVLIPLAVAAGVLAIVGRAVVVRRISAAIVFLTAVLFLRFELVGPGAAAVGAVLMFLGGRRATAPQQQAPVAPPPLPVAVGPGSTTLAPPPPPTPSAAGYAAPSGAGSPDPRFAEVAGQYAQYRQQVAAGQLSPDRLDELLMSLVFEHEGRYWMIGANTGQWYASQGGEWVPATPPESF